MTEKFLRSAIDISVENVKNGGGPFGAVIVKDGEIIASAGNQVTTHNDPTAHAEINAIREAAQKLQTFDLSGCEIYASCEPCPMCLGAIYWARLDKLYFAASREDAQEAGFDDALIYEEISLEPEKRKVPTRQLLRDEAAQAFSAWKRHEDKTEY
ncbi:MAG TPA: nucleoside deaminase [Bacteroidales bacterium]|nr:nucleoside deaminase [Bacteroidales bacterium]